MEPLSKIFASSKMLPSKAISQLKADTPNISKPLLLAKDCFVVVMARETVSDKLDKMI